jgi:glucokinase
MSPPCVIGIDAGGTKLLGGVVDEGLAVRHRVHRFWRGTERQELLRVMVEAVDEARAAAPHAAAVGFGIPALVDHDTGATLFSTHLPLEGVRFRALMEERLNLPVFVDNDANLALVAEARAGAAQGVLHALLLTLGTGIGGGILIDGKLQRGSRGAGAELGHVVVDLDGPPCQGRCPGRGCLEVMASGSAIGREGAEAAARLPDSALGEQARAGREITGAIVTELAHDGDDAAIGVLRRVGERLGAGIAGLVNAFDPEIVVIGGGAVAAGDLLLDPARAAVAERVLPPHRDHVKVVPAHFGEEAGMLGAAILALEEGRV